MSSDKFRQPDFIRIFTENGLTYSQARRAYSSMIDALESAMVNRQTVRLGHLGSLQPRVVPPRSYTMGCLKKKGGARDNKKYQYTVGRRIKFVFKLNEAFSKRHAFK